MGLRGKVGLLRSFARYVPSRRVLIFQIFVYGRVSIITILVLETAH